MHIYGSNTGGTGPYPVTQDCKNHHHLTIFGDIPLFQRAIFDKI